MWPQPSPIWSIWIQNSSDCQIGLDLRPRPILTIFGISLIQLFPNWTALRPICKQQMGESYTILYAEDGKWYGIVRCYQYSYTFRYLRISHIHLHSTLLTHFASSTYFPLLDTIPEKKLITTKTYLNMLSY